MFAFQKLDGQAQKAGPTMIKPAPENMNEPAEYHAHIYFELDDLTATEQMRQQLIDAIPAEGVVHKMFARVVGPHPKPMFEIDYPASIKIEVQALLEQYRGDRSVLIHPVIDDELTAHTWGAQWLGPVLDLYLDKL